MDFGVGTRGDVLSGVVVVGGIVRVRVDVSGGFIFAPTACMGGRGGGIGFADPIHGRLLRAALVVGRVLAASALFHACAKRNFRRSQTSRVFIRQPLLRAFRPVSGSYDYCRGTSNVVGRHYGAGSVFGVSRPYARSRMSRGRRLAPSGSGASSSLVFDRKIFRLASLRRQSQSRFRSFATFVDVVGRRLGACLPSSRRRKSSCRRCPKSPRLPQRRNRLSRTGLSRIGRTGLSALRTDAQRSRVLGKSRGLERLYDAFFSDVGLNGGHAVEKKNERPCVFNLVRRFADDFTFAWPRSLQDAFCGAVAGFVRRLDDCRVDAQTPQPNANGIRINVEPARGASSKSA